MWQPIETAPKDRRILFFAYGDTVYAGEWNEWRKSFEPDNWEGPSFDEGEITHWMPLPAPPPMIADDRPSPIPFGAVPDRLFCSRCNKKLSRKTARMIDRKPLCSACMFASA